MEPFTVACCQVRAYDLSDAEENLQNLLRTLDDAGLAGAKLVGLPECAYPAYYVGDTDPYARPGVRGFDKVCSLFAAKARQYGYWLAAGMAVPHGPGRLTNSAMVFAPDGTIQGRYDKSFLWHFDTSWFERGTEFPVFDAGFCKFGVLICADGRQPEVARSLVLNGAELILDLTAWVSWGRTVQELSTPQCEYMMPVRAFENGVWVAAADKWGPEAGTIIYAGRSCVIDPEGIVRVAAPSDCDAVVTFEIEPVAVERPRRRPSLYGRLVEPTLRLPISKLLDTPIVPARANNRIAVIPDEGSFDAGRLARRYSELRAQGADLVVAPGMPGSGNWHAALPEIEAAVRENGGAFAFAVATDGATPAAVGVLITPDQTYEHAPTHGSWASAGEVNAEVVNTPAGNIALLCGDEGLVPEVARSLVLEGADIIAWSAFAPHSMTERIARCRSDENRVYTAVAWQGGGLITAPTGAVLTAVPAGSGVAMAAQVNPALSRWKDMAPGTNVIFDRLPAAYGALVR
ncbi:MAG TPA: nitrilase-related carbon-nitrogen hydrolase [Tepidiformaceae bacterium]